MRVLRETRTIILELSIAFIYGNSITILFYINFSIHVHVQSHMHSVQRLLHRRLNRMDSHVTMTRD